MFVGSTTKQRERILEMKYSFPLFVMGCPYTDKGSRVTSGWQTAMMGSPSASSMAISVSMVKW